MSFLIHGSLTLISTPGGIEMGVLPSLEDRCVVVEKSRREEGAGEVVWKAGTRKPGSVVVEGAEEEAMTLSRARLPVLCANIVPSGEVRSRRCNSRYAAATGQDVNCCVLKKIGVPASAG
jgi:hypothetical protein